MSRVDDALTAQIRNIEVRSGKAMREWKAIIAATGLTKHTEVVAFLKSDHAMSHGDAHRTALVVRDALAKPSASASGGAANAGVSSIQDALLAEVRRLGDDIEIAPKKGYLSLRRAKQFAMIRPASKHIDVGLILPGAAVTKRLESAATFNALFTHRVRVGSVDEIDAQLRGWLKRAYERAT